MWSSGVASAAAHGYTHAGAHVCWGFTERSEFVDAAADFLRAGLARHERLLFIAEPPVTAMLDARGHLGSTDRLLADGRLLLSSLGGTYDSSASLDWREQAATFERLAAEAVAEGFTGLRVAADTTPLVADAGTWRPFLDWELAAGALMVSKPISGFCGFDAGVVGDLLPQLAAVHPLRQLPGPDPSFSLFFESGTTLRLAGEVDITNGELLTEALRSALVVHPGEQVGVDLTELAFIDVSGLRRLNGVARELRTEGRALSLLGCRRLVRECALFLGFSDLSGAIEGGDR